MIDAKTKNPAALTHAGFFYLLTYRIQSEALARNSNTFHISHVAAQLMAY